MCAEARKIPDSTRYLDVLLCDCELNSLAETTLSSIGHDPAILQDPSVTMFNGTAETPQTPMQNRHACLAILALVRQNTDHVFQPSPLASKQKLETFTGADPFNPSIPLDTPRAMEDRYQHQYHNAVAMRAMLQPESCSLLLCWTDTLTRLDSWLLTLCAGQAS